MSDAQVLELEPLPEKAQQQFHLPADTGAAQLPSLSSSSPIAVMLSAMRQGATLEQMEKMMDLQERWEGREAEKAFNEALAAFKAEDITILKTKAVGYTTRDGDFTGYKHAALADVVEAVGAALSKHGFSFRWDVQQARDWVTVRCILKHARGHSEQIEMGGPPDNSGKKNAIQQIASTVSYLQRYTLKAICGVAEADDDDDGAGGADGGEPEQPRQPAPMPRRASETASQAQQPAPEQQPRQQAQAPAPAPAPSGNSSTPADDGTPASVGERKNVMVTATAKRKNLPELLAELGITADPARDLDGLTKAQFKLLKSRL